MKKLKSLILSTIAVLALFVTFVPVNTFAATTGNAFQGCQSTSTSTTGAMSTSVCASNTGDISGIIQTVINVLLFIIGAVAVVVIIIAGIQYVTSAGDSGAVAKAKNTLMYAIIGLIVAFLAYAIVSWVYKEFVK